VPQTHPAIFHDINTGCPLVVPFNGLIEGTGLPFVHPIFTYHVEESLTTE
jgi:hypothetical protein